MWATGGGGFNRKAEIIGRFWGIQPEQCAYILLCTVLTHLNLHVYVIFHEHFDHFNMAVLRSGLERCVSGKYTIHLQYNDIMFEH